jgi:hypothetical protein
MTTSTSMTRGTRECAPDLVRTRCTPRQRTCGCGGGKGADRIRLDLLTIAPFGGKSPKKKVLEARGGAGRDRLIGSSTGVADRLIGGRGSDHADGRAGKRDYCVAEKTVRCERP